MTRLPDLLRRLLLDIETAPRAVIDPVAVYHARLLCEAGYVEAQIMTGLKGDRVHASRLTWKGHELLDAIRTDAQWAAVLERLSGQSAPFDGVIVPVAFEIAATSAGLQVVPTPAGDEQQGTSDVAARAAHVGN